MRGKKRRRHFRAKERVHEKGRNGIMEYSDPKRKKVPFFCMERGREKPFSDPTEKEVRSRYPGRRSIYIKGEKKRGGKLS